MGSVIVWNDPCPHCGANALWGEFYSTGEYKYSCAACGSYEGFRFEWAEGKPLYRAAVIPVEQVALTVRVGQDADGPSPIVWESVIPDEADTDFIDLFLKQKDDEISSRYPQFIFPDLTAIRRQSGASPFRAIEQHLPCPSRKDDQPYIRLDSRRNRLELQNNAGRRELVVHKGRYRVWGRPGGGIISIVDNKGESQFERVFPLDITVRRAERLWAAHTNTHTDYAKSYLTLIRDGKLEVLKGSLPKSNM